MPAARKELLDPISEQSSAEISTGQADFSKESKSSSFVASRANLGPSANTLSHEKQIELPAPERGGTRPAVKRERHWRYPASAAPGKGGEQSRLAKPTSGELNVMGNTPSKVRGN